MKKFLRYYFIGAFLLVIVFMGSSVRLRASACAGTPSDTLKATTQNFFA